MSGKLRFLGTGASTGVPIVGCMCDVCHSHSEYNKRSRVSALIDYQGKRFLIDVGPDFRTQALRFDINELDGVIITHTHYDHIGGVDDLRPIYYFRQSQIPCLLSRDSFIDMKTRLHYMMHPLEDEETECKQFRFQILEDDEGDVSFCDTKFSYCSYYQAGMRVNGFRFGALAYVTDIRDYSENVFEMLHGVEVLIVSALRETASEVHFSLDEAKKFAGRVGAKETWLTHISHTLDHEKTNRDLPPNIQLAHDGQEVTFR